MPVSFTRSLFEPHQDSVFTTDAGEQGIVELALVEVNDKTPEGFSGEQFSLIFLGPQELYLPQRIYPLQHPELGEIDLFLVPVGQRDEGILYEAYFNLVSKPAGS